MGYETIRYEVQDGVAIVTLNRPEAYNALNLALGGDLFHATLEADEDRAVRCIVVTGAGKAFCAGGDVKDFNDNADRIGVVIKELTTYLHGAVSRLARTAKPVTAKGRPRASRRLPDGRRRRRRNRGVASRTTAATATAGRYRDMSTRIDDRSSSWIGE